MYQYKWDESTGGLVLTSTSLKFSKEPRPVYYKELNLLGFDRYWNYAKDDAFPYMWAEANFYYYRGRLVAKLKGGNLYQAPEIEIIEAPEPQGESLRFVDIDSMVKKNEEILESLTQQTIKKIYQAYTKFEQKVDIFHVSFSGGKDSEVTLDLVQRALPHNKFITIFGDTGMEFPDTYNAIEKTKQRCADLGIRFYTASSHLIPEISWKLFGPPSSVIRWCCSVHKTTPQLLLLRDILKKDEFTEMAFVGIRADESVRRSEYDYISYGTKHRGQYSCNPILEWNSAEIYLYLYTNKLPVNDSYKKGISRAGCLVCPMSSIKNDYMNSHCYPEQSKHFINLIKELNGSEGGDPERLKSYLSNIGWKARKNGRDLSISSKIYYNETIEDDFIVIKFEDPYNNWMQWINTIGTFYFSDKSNEFSIERNGKTYPFKITDLGSGKQSVAITKRIYTEFPELCKLFKQVFRKSAYCVNCKVCEANCKFGCLQIQKDKVTVSKECHKCGQCHNIDTGCLAYKSLWLSKGTGNMKKSLDCYGTHAPKMEWFEQFFRLKEKFATDHTLGSVQISNFKRFLRDAELSNSKEIYSELALHVENWGLDNLFSWAIMLANLSYTPQIGWLVSNVNFNLPVTQKELTDKLKQSGATDSGAKAIPGAYRRLALLPFSKVGFGSTAEDRKGDYTLNRTPWLDPDPRVILYSLYKFAEACGDYYQFTLTRLMNNNIDSDGISPAQIFGIDRQSMERILNGLTINHPEYISATFTLDLDNISLRSDKTSQDVLTLF